MFLSELKLRNFFSRFGLVVDARLIRDRPSGALRGYGFIQFSTSSAAQRAIATRFGFIDGVRIAILQCNSFRRTAPSNPSSFSYPFHLLPLPPPLIPLPPPLLPLPPPLLPLPPPPQQTAAPQRPCFDRISFGGGQVD